MLCSSLLLRLFFCFLPDGLILRSDLLLWRALSLLADDAQGKFISCMFCWLILSGLRLFRFIDYGT